ncbi:MAG: class C beta-lactamase-related serine hydrolase, partial [Comamonadaceae bacterium]
MKTRPAWQDRVSTCREIETMQRWILTLGWLIGAACAAAQTPPLTMASPPDAIAASALGTQKGLAFVGTLHGDRTAYGAARNDVPSVSAAAVQQPLFEIGSVTKVFTGLLLAQAVERGELHLDDRIGTLLAGKAALPPAVAALTLGQLVTHSACLPLMADGVGTGPGLVAQLRDFDRPALWAALARVALSAPRAPCEAVYSNFGMAVLGELLSEKFGQPWEVLVRELITGPLGMHDTVLSLGDQAGRQHGVV